VPRRSEPRPLIGGELEGVLSGPRACAGRRELPASAVLAALASRRRRRARWLPVSLLDMAGVLMPCGGPLGAKDPLLISPSQGEKGVNLAQHSLNVRFHLGVGKAHHAIAVGLQRLGGPNLAP
jgi:hypothetical protein